MSIRLKSNILSVIVIRVKYRYSNTWQLKLELAQSGMLDRTVQKLQISFKLSVEVNIEPN